LGPAGAARWAPGLGFVVAVVHLLLAGLALAGGGFIAQDLLWVVVPVIVVVYLLGPGRRAPGGTPSSPIAARVRAEDGT
jgi:hypothetical protein